MKPVEDVLRTVPLDNPYSRLHINLMYTGRWLQEHFTQLLAPHGLTEPQFNVLRILRGQRGASMHESEVQKRMVHWVDRMAPLTAALEERRWIERAPAGLAITLQGLELLHKLDAAVETQRHEVFSSLKPEEAVLMGQLLDRIRGDR